MSAALVWLVGHRKALLYGLLGLALCGAVLYVQQLGRSRDAWRHTAESLQMTLEAERSMAAGLAAMARDKAQVASAAASAQVVQKNREIAAKNSDLKKEINHAYQNRTHANEAPTGGDTGATNAAAKSFGCDDPAVAQVGYGGAGGDCDVGFVGDADRFKRLWNAANRAGGVSSAAAP